MGFNVKQLHSFCLVLASIVSLESGAWALPFNDDLVGGQLAVGTMMRPKAPGSVPMGSLPDRVETREAALTMVNPQKGDPLSTLNGERLFQINCSPCHGSYLTGKHEVGAVSNVMPGVDLSLDMYKVKPDGHFFGYVYFGGMAIMPAYGWKFSSSELWDIVNYVRHVQGVQ